MRVTVFIVTLLAALCFASVAAAATIVDINDHPLPQYQKWVRQDELPTYHGKVVFILSHELVHSVEPAASGFALPTVDSLGDGYLDKPTSSYPLIVVDPKSFDRSDKLYWWEIRDVFYHEMGHVYDFKVLDDPDRTQILHIWGYGHKTAANWTDGEDHYWLQTHLPGQELFAEAYRIGAWSGDLTAAPYLIDVFSYDIMNHRQLAKKQHQEDQTVNVIYRAAYWKYYSDQPYYRWGHVTNRAAVR